MRNALICVILFSSAAIAQIQGNRPDLYTSCVDSQIPATCTMGDGVTTGQLIVVSAYAADFLVSAPAVDDNSGLGNTYTCTTPTNVPPPTGNPTAGGAAFICYTVAAGNSGSFTVTAHFTNPNTGKIGVSIFNGLSGTPDGSVTSGTALGGDGTTVSTNYTTTVSGDVVVCAMARSLLNSLSRVASSASQMEAIALYGTGASHMIHANTIGTYTCGYKGVTQGTGDTSSWAVQALAFNPSSTVITDTVMPQGAIGTAYSSTIHPVGGTAAFTCSITVGALPAGLSLGGTGNCTISGTPSGSPATTSFTAHADDGAGHTANASLSITVGASFNTPVFKSTLPEFVPSGVGSIDVPSVQCGDVIAITTYGATYFDIDGFVNTLTGTRNFWKGTLGETYYRVPMIGGTSNAPATTFVSTPIIVNNPSTDTISWSTPLPLGNYHAGIITFITVLSNVQQGVDVGPTVYAPYSQGSQTLSTSMTTLVPNSLVFGYWGASNDDLGGTSSMAFSAPFTDITSGMYSMGAGVDAYAMQASPGSVTATVTSTGNDAGTHVTIRNLGLMAFRPGLQSACTVRTYAGEKHRRTVW